MCVVVGNLFVATSRRFFDGGRHAVGDFVRVHDDAAVDVTGGTASGLGEASVASEKTLFVRIHDRHEAHLRQVQSFAEEVDTHQHVDRSVPQFPQDFHSIQRLDVGVDVAAFDAQAFEVLREFLGHSFGQCGHQDALVVGQRFPDLHHQIVDLVVTGTNVNGRIEQPRGANHLLHHHAFGTFELEVRRGGAHVNGLVDDAVKFLVGEGAVVQSGGQSKAMVDQIDLARPVATEHGANLRNGHVALVNHHEEVFGEVVEETERSLTGLTTVEIPGVILDP